MAGQEDPSGGRDEPSGDPDGPAVGRDEAEAVLAAREELGPSYEPALVDSFMERVETALGRRVDDRLARAEEAARRRGDTEKRQFALGIVSLGVGIPITAIAADSGIPGLTVAWLGIVAVNLAHAVAVRGSRGR